MADTTEVTRRYDEAFNNKDAAARLAHQASDIEVVMPGGLTLRGGEEVGRVAGAFWEALPDVELTRETEIAARDMEAVEGTLTGTHTGVFRTPQGEIPASGNHVTLRYASVRRVRDGKIVTEHLYFDQLEFLQQIGALPPPQGR